MYNKEVLQHTAPPLVSNFTLSRKTIGQVAEKLKGNLFTIFAKLCLPHVIVLFVLSVIKKITEKRYKTKYVWCIVIVIQNKCKIKFA